MQKGKKIENHVFLGYFIFKDENFIHIITNKDSFNMGNDFYLYNDNLGRLKEMPKIGYTTLRD